MEQAGHCKGALEEIMYYYRVMEAMGILVDLERHGG